MQRTNPSGKRSKNIGCALCQSPRYDRYDRFLPVSEDFSLQHCEREVMKNRVEPVILSFRGLRCFHRAELDEHCLAIWREPPKQSHPSLVSWKHFDLNKAQSQQLHLYRLIRLIVDGKTARSGAVQGRFQMTLSKEIIWLFEQIRPKQGQYLCPSSLKSLPLC